MEALEASQREQTKHRLGLPWMTMQREDAVDTEIHLIVDKWLPSAFQKFHTRRAKRASLANRRLDRRLDEPERQKAHARTDSVER